MKMKKVIVLILVIATAAVSAFAQAKIPAPKDQLYIEVSCLGGLDYFSAHKYGMKMVGEELGVKTDYVGPVDYDINAMVAAFEQAISRKPQGIVVFGSEPSLNAIVDKAAAKGIPVVTVDSDLPGSKRIAYVGTGNYNAGVLGGNELAKILDGKGKVAVIYHPGQLGLEQRLSGYRDALAPFKGIQIVQVVDDQGDTNMRHRLQPRCCKSTPIYPVLRVSRLPGGPVPPLRFARQTRLARLRSFLWTGAPKCSKALPRALSLRQLCSKAH